MVGGQMVLETANKTLLWPDYLVFAFVLAVSLSIGIYYGCTGGMQRTTSEYLLADREMHFLPVTLSLLASFMSAITLLGTPSEVYRFGSIYWFIWIGYLIMMPFVAHIFLPVFFNLGITSVFEYLELRFSKGVRVCAAIAYIIQMVLYMAIVLYAPSLALSAVTGLNVWIGVFSVGIVCTIYTAVGGMKAVMWTDTFQIVLMFAGLIAVLIQGSVDKGGFGKIWEIMEKGQRIEWANWDPSPLVRHTTWSLAFGGCFTWLPIYGVNQAQVQRALAVPKLKHAQWAIWLNFFGLTGLLTICGLCGFVVYAEYFDCDPLTSGRISSADQLLPLYVMDRLSQFKGLPGLFTACLFSGALSTVSSGLNSLAAVTLEDFVVSLCYPKMPDARKTVISKIIAVIYGAICLALTFVAANLGGILQAALALFGMIGGPQLGLFFLGILYPCANTWGAYVGFFSALIFSFWLGIGAQIHKPIIPKAPVSINGCVWLNTTNLNMTTTTTERMTTLAMTTLSTTSAPEPPLGGFYSISYIWYGALATGIVVVVGLIVSFATGSRKRDTLDPKLIMPIFDIFFCYLPKSLRRKLWCGVDHAKEEDVKVDKDVEHAVNSYGDEKIPPQMGVASYSNPGYEKDEGPTLRIRGRDDRDQRAQVVSSTRL